MTTPEETSLENIPQEMPRRKATVRLGRREMAWISISIIVAILLLFLYIVFRGFMSYKVSHDLTIGRENLNSIYKAMGAYAEDYDRILPPAEEWYFVAQGYLSNTRRAGGKESLLRGPGDGKTIRYVFNSLASGLNLETGEPGANVKKMGYKTLNPSEVVLLIERPGGKEGETVFIPPINTRSARTKLYEELAFPHGVDEGDKAKTLILYANGSIRTWTRKDLQER